jgi:hypothetical protein
LRPRDDGVCQRRTQFERHSICRYSARHRVDVSVLKRSLEMN